ncbi:tripartite tricarboxylate transporter TctB family protein [Siminovitchia sediminis]|uniref:Tripartite tricarboxylate transporter TctB family protein n=1 Tax=Siminovitchia sediminis TaxID=1274353 RepID=A0ABW4KEQ2_9BACI
MIQKSKIDLLSSCLLLLLASIILWETRGLSEVSYIFPRTVGIILLLLSSVYFVKSLVSKDTRQYFTHMDRRKIILIALSMAGYVLFIVIAGFWPASILYITVTAWYLQRDEPLKSRRRVFTQSLSVAFIFSTAFYLLFRYVFFVPLPVSIFVSS